MYSPQEESHNVFKNIRCQKHELQYLIFQSNNILSELNSKILRTKDLVKLSQKATF